MPDDLPAPIDFHQARLHEPVDVRVQAAQPGGQLRRKHVSRALREVHRRPPLVRFPIERAPLNHVVRDIRDMHAQPVVSVRQLLNGDRIVEIAGVLAVNRDCRPISKIGPLVEIALLHRASQADGLGHSLR